MVKHQTVTYSYSCDVCGQEAEISHTVSYGTGGRPEVYEIDLCAADNRKLTKAHDGLIALLGHGRKASSGRRRASSSERQRETIPRSSAAVYAGAIRQWAREQGYEIADRGRISAEIREAYAEAT
jgi:hypothetical protein